MKFKGSKRGEFLKIRKAEGSDAPLILGFIKDLAEFEKLSHEVVATEEKIRKTVFEKKGAEVWIVENASSNAVGFALCFQTYSTFLAKPGLYMEDLFVLPEERGKGYGTKLLKFLAQTAIERDYGRFEWSVLNWNRKAIDFYEKIGARPQNEWTVYRLAGKDLEVFAKDK